MPASVLAGLLLAAGSLLIVLSVVALVCVAWLLRGLAEGRRAMRLQMVVGLVLVLTLGARVYLIAAGAFDPAPALALVVVDLALGIAFWRSLSILSSLLASDPPQGASPLAWAFPIALAVVGLGAVFPALARSSLSMMNLAATVLAITLWGVSMAEVNRLLRTVGRRRTALLAVASGAFLGLPQIPAVVTRGWFGREDFLGTDLVLIEVAGVVLAGLCAAVAAASLLHAVARADAEAIATRHVLERAASIRGAAVVAVAFTSTDVLDLLGGNANLIPDRGAESRACPECGRPVAGLEYHRHGLPERRARAAGVTRVQAEPEETSARRVK